jgi:glycosyltransferase involved in cell wall biosynthesis
MKTTVSIALCTYNGDKFLQKQIDSYLNQTVLPDEIIISDDGSKDRTKAILQWYIGENPDIKWRLIENENRLGASKNFEKALSLCAGEIIFLSDQDDIWNKVKIERTISFFESSSESDACFSNAALMDDNDRELTGTLLDNSFFKPGIRQEYKKTDLLYWSILLGNMMTGATMAIRRRALADILPFHLELGKKYWHDGWIGLSLMSDNRIGYLDETLMRYRIHAGQQIGVVVRDDPFEKWIMLNEYDENNIKEYFQKYLSAYTVLNKLKKIKPVEPGLEKRIKKEYLNQRKKYFDSQSFSERKLRLLKWWLRGINYISFKDLMTL